VIPDDDKDANLVAPIAAADDEDVVIPPNNLEEDDDQAQVHPKPVTNKTL